MLILQCICVSFSFVCSFVFVVIVVFISMLLLFDWYLVSVCIEMFMLCLNGLNVRFVEKVLLIVVMMLCVCVVVVIVCMLGIFIVIELGVLIQISCVFGWISLVMLVLISGLQKCVVMLKFFVSQLLKLVFGLYMLCGISMLLFVFMILKQMFMIVVRFDGCSSVCVLFLILVSCCVSVSDVGVVCSLQCYWLLLCQISVCIVVRLGNMIVEVCVIGGMNEWKFFGMMLLG